MKNFKIISEYKFWLVASIITAILFSLSGFNLAFETAYTVQDDARQHVFWLQKLNDNTLFKDDLIANYFSSVAPAGYKFVYWFANLLGIEPFLCNKILPVFLGVGSTIYLYLVTIEIFPVPLGGFFSCLLFNQNLWMLDDLSSGTPRAFFYVLFLGFIYYLLRRSLFPCLLLIILQGLFYPVTVLISGGVLALNLIIQRKKRYFYLIGLILAILILAIYKFQTAEFNQVISIETARQLPEFYPEGRSSFFLKNPFSFWLTGRRSGFFPYEWQYFVLSMVILLVPKIIRYPRQFPLKNKINSKVEIIWQILLASFGLFLLAHLVLFKLHLPSRYSQHTWRIAIALVDGIAIAVFFNSVLNNISPKIALSPKIIKSGMLAIAIGLLLYPTYAVQSRPYRLGYVNGNAPELYQFLQQQPKDIMIATLSEEGDFIPSLAERSVLVSEEYGIPYHWDYYQIMRRRVQDLIQAQYASSPMEVAEFVEKYQVDFWLLDQNAFTTAYLSENPWLRQFQPQTQKAISLLQANKKPVLADKIDSCSVLQTGNLNLLDSNCLTSKKQSSAKS